MNDSQMERSIMTPLEHYQENMKYQGWIGPGWEPMVYTLDKFLQSIDPNYKVLQVKEKFGGLRFYYEVSATATDDAVRQARALVSFAEALSFETCEECGASGTLLDVGGWWRTLCSPCAEKAREERAKRFAPDS